jgi:hypothetical protein
MLLHNFAFFPKANAGSRESYLDYIGEYARGGGTFQQSDLEIYVQDNFQIAFAQGKVLEAPDSTWAICRVGNLLTPTNEPITMLFMKNRKPGRQPYFFTRVFGSSVIPVKLDDGREIHVDAPPAPTYDPPPYQEHYTLQMNWMHCMVENATRLEAVMPNLTDHQRFLCVWAAAQIAHGRSRVMAVPQWFCDKNAEEGGYQWLLPLHLTHPEPRGRMDLFAALVEERSRGEYRIRTLLMPVWVYPHLRALHLPGAQLGSWSTAA